VKNVVLLNLFVTQCIFYCSSSPESDDSDEEMNPPSHMSQSRDSSSGSLTFEALFPSMRQVYGVSIDEPKDADIYIYKR
jgi:hypothetical protein